MVFSSLEFIYLFLFPTLGVFIVLRHLKWEKGIIYWLIITSLIFYAWWSVSYLILLLLSVIINFGFHKLLLVHRSRFILTMATILNLATLAYFKYADFLIENINNLTQAQIPMLNVILPLAISFFTFQQIAFHMDVAKGEVHEVNPINYALFVSFFPQLIAGPIVHHHEMMGQFANKDNWRINSRNIYLGIFIFSIGIFKKVLLPTLGLPIIEI